MVPSNLRNYQKLFRRLLKVENLRIILGNYITFARVSFSFIQTSESKKFCDIYKKLPWPVALSKPILSKIFIPSPTASAISLLNCCQKLF